jgi:hypothetical protein
MAHQGRPGQHQFGGEGGCDMLAPWHQRKPHHDYPIFIMQWREVYWSTTVLFMVRVAKSRYTRVV